MRLQGCKLKAKQLFHKIKLLKKKKKTGKNNKKSSMKQLDKQKTLVGIRGKFFLALLVPILFMASFGIFSYQKVKQVLVSNYEKSTINTLNAMSDYLDLGLDSVFETSIQLMFNDNVTKYYNRKVDSWDTIETVRALNLLENELFILEGTNNFLSGVHLIGEVGKGVSSSGGYISDFYPEFKETEEAKLLKEKKLKFIWVGKHEQIDEKLGISQDSYALSLIRTMDKDNGYIVMDIDSKTIGDMLKLYELGEGSITGFVTSDGKEFLSDKELSEIFTDKSYVNDKFEAELTSGYSYETYNGSPYLFIYSKIGDTGAMICTLVPESTIFKEAQGIKAVIMVFVVLACLFAGIIGIVFSGNISKVIYKLMNATSLAAKGDLTVNFDTNRKDEFNFLSKGLTTMVLGMRNLIGDVSKVGLKVSNSADALSKNSKEILESTKDISLTIEEIENGVTQQASDTENCLGQMNLLSGQIDQVKLSTNEIDQIAEVTKTLVTESIETVDDLTQKSKATSEITDVIITEIGTLELHSKNIESFVGIINDIAEQTNLLSLNASIEAARAGEAGKGFAVVASEIRKLAEQSKEATKKIRNIVEEIQEKTKQTSSSAKKAEDIVNTQEGALNKTIEAFHKINSHVGNLTENLHKISMGMKEIDSAKNDTLQSIENISAVSQETAASSEEVNATTTSLISIIENLSVAADDLASDGNKLKKSIEIFKI